MEEKGRWIGIRSGSLIVSTYLVQGIMGLIITIGIGYTFIPNFFKAAGILLPMGFGQGPGQANNVGTIYENLGMVGGRSFALAIAASGFLWACIAGVIYLNILKRKNLIQRNGHEEISGSVTIDMFEQKGEIPVSESVDRLSVQVALVLLVYLGTYLTTWGLTSGIDGISPALGNTVNSLLWGFNFIVGSLLAMLLRLVLRKLKNKSIMTRQYQNNYLLSRFTGLAFDVMIVAGIASIEIGDLSGNWLVFLLMGLAGGLGTFFYMKWITGILYPDYYYEGFVSMYGMMTGTVSSGILLLREIDPGLKTPAANNMVTGSCSAIVFALPMLILIGMAPKSTTLLFAVLGMMIIYLIGLLLVTLKLGAKEK
jgi:ESS family glutamate:Na+ symporter